MSKVNAEHDGIDYSKPLKYSADKAMEVALEMLAKRFDGKVPDEVVRVLEDMFMAGAYYAVDISLYGQDYTEGDVSTLDYSQIALGDEAHDASKIIQILEEEDEDDGGDDDDGGGGQVMIPRQLH